MSGKVVGWAMDQRTGSPTAKLVLVKLADNANEEGYCWPSLTHIVEHTELAQSTVYKYLKELEGAGLICSTKIDVNRGDGPPYYADGWRLNVPQPPQFSPDGQDSETRKPALRGEKKSPRGGNITPRDGKKIPRGGSAYKEEPSIEPPLNRAPKAGGDQPGIAAPPLNGRGDALVRLIGSQEYEAYFSEAELIDGPTPTIVIPMKGYAHKAMERFLGPLHHLFGEDVRVVGRAEWRREQRARNSEKAHSSRRGA